MVDAHLQAIVNAILGVLPGRGGSVALHEPTFAGNEWTYVKDCLDTGWVSSVGRYVDRLESLLAEFTGVKYAVAVVNGTAALHMCLHLAGVEANDEVLVPTLTFVATANAVRYCHAVPHFVDVEERSLGLDPKKLAEYLTETVEVRGQDCINRITGRRIRAVVPMHTFGHPVDLDPLVDVCERFGLTLVEDAAESLGSYYKGRHTGLSGLVSALSFNGNKTVTTGGGGAILTNDEQLARLAKHLTTTAKVPHRWAYQHDAVGYNYRMPNVNAAIGCAQMEQLPGFITRKRMLADRYREAFRKLAGVRFFEEPSYAQSNYWLNVLVLDREVACERDALLELMHARGILTRPVWALMHELPMYTTCPRMDLSVAEDLQRRVLNIPSSAHLGVMDA